MNPIELRSEIIYKRTYSRPLNEEGTVFESWDETVHRVIEHQRWLWERAKDEMLDEPENDELEELRSLLLSRKSSVSGRTLWLGGTKVARQREASQFNCSGLKLESINDAVDQIWLLMQGCGVGFHPEVGTLNGFLSPIPNIAVINSELEVKLEDAEDNIETVEDGVWTISVGDSAEAWAKAFGKLLAGKNTAHTLVFDFSRIRPAGERLKGYGWISSGDASIAVAMPAIAEILNKRAGQLLTRIDLLDVGNWMGTVLSSRRSAEIAFHRFGDPEWEEFAQAKANCGIDNPQRYQSNNSLLFHHKPTKLELRGLFEMMLEAGGSEPGFINAQAAEIRAPWFKLLNPCAEILLGNKSFCNLCETNLSAFNGDRDGLYKAIRLIGRANYRQTCVDLRDGVLQDAWHELNEFLRLTGVGVTGIVGWEHLNEEGEWKALREKAKDGVDSMADELKLPRSKAVTTIKPSGTLSKLMGTTEGIHKPLGRYIFNNV
ncbi:MAG: ribonucleoside-triphosphate reductase, adenosylcobalamin-dependent, partial [Epsilonproteobacteria bacterium]